jgi:putative protease
MAGKQYGLRAAAGNFEPEQLQQAVRDCHAAGVKCFVTVNVMPRGHELEDLKRYLEQLDAFGVDAVILADLGLLDLAKKHAPHTKIHISTQTSIVNHEAARMYHSLGADRVVLARELSLEEVANIRAKTPKELEIEVFVHGAMCVSYSGRCLLSNYLTGRDANHGACAQPCRWNYHVVEQTRPGQYMPVEEDERGTYIFNSRDMCMIEHIPDLIKTGVDSFKIEGRAKSFYYTAAVTNAYRRARDLYLRDPEGFVLPPAIRDEVDKISHRHYHTGFYFGQPGEYYAESRYIRDYEVCAVVKECDEAGNALLEQRNRFFVGDSAELLMPGCDPVPLSIPPMCNGAGEPIESAPHPMMDVRLRLPVQAPPMSVLRTRKEK